MGAGADIGWAVKGDEKGGKNVSRRIIKSDEREEPLGKIGDQRGAGQAEETMLASFSGS